MFEVNKLRQVREKDCYQQVEHMQVPNGTGPGVRRSKRPVSACYSRRKCSMETSHKSVKALHTFCLARNDTAPWCRCSIDRQHTEDGFSVWLLVTPIKDYHFQSILSLCLFWKASACIDILITRCTRLGVKQLPVGQSGASLIRMV